ncbi:MAG: hypothetical protein LBT02_00560, partial [Rickettsiales bacterium]|nr:hypothetical protein [Rickettsiales bacterium]
MTEIALTEEEERMAKREKALEDLQSNHLLNEEEKEEMRKRYSTRPEAMLTFMNRRDPFTKNIELVIVVSEGFVQTEIKTFSCNEFENLQDFQNKLEPLVAANIYEWGNIRSLYGNMMDIYEFDAISSGFSIEERKSVKLSHLESGVVSSLLGEEVKDLSVSSTPSAPSPTIIPTPTPISVLSSAEVAELQSSLPIVRSLPTIEQINATSSIATDSNAPIVSEAANVDISKPGDTTIA